PHPRAPRQDRPSGALPPLVPISQEEGVLFTHEDRLSHQRSANLPIHSERRNLIARLDSDKVVVVTGEPGSGRTTQIPQYLADYLPLKTVLTQPRRAMVVPLARHIASQFDGTDAQGAGVLEESVGYCTGRKTVPGSRLMVMSDEALVQTQQTDPSLSEYSALVIDETHMGSLHTDLVLGMARQILKTRDDFRVVVMATPGDARTIADFLNPDVTPARGMFAGLLRRRPVTTRPTVRVLSVGAGAVGCRPVVHTQRPKGKYLDIDAVVDGVGDALAAEPSGHCLCFLPNQKQVSKAASQFSRSCPRNLDVKAFDDGIKQSVIREMLSYNDKGGRRRMVVFCTDVLETCLTLPNVRVVVDSGRTMETRYYPKRHMQVSEEVPISKAAADRRLQCCSHGSSGYCLRLYNYDTLKRDTNEPEILRSSLDLVVLRLLSLGLDAATFPFLSRPHPSAIKESYAELQRLRCVEGAGSACTLTETGKTFVSLPFDPRLSHFVLSAGESGALLLASEIAALVSASKPIYRILPKTTKGKGVTRGAQRARVADGASEHGSDLLHQCEVYGKWYSAGAVSGKCPKHPKQKTAKGEGCFKCRAEHAKAHNLDTMTLETVANTVFDVLKKVLPQKPAELREMMTGEDRHGSMDLTQSALERFSQEKLRVVGQCLAESFPGNIGQKLMPADPRVGAFLLQDKVKVGIASESALYQSHDPLFVSMKYGTAKGTDSVTVAMCHPLDPSWISAPMRRQIKEDSIKMVKCYERSNVGVFVMRYLPDALAKESWGQLAAAVHNSELGKVEVYGPHEHRAAIARSAGGTVEHWMDQYREWQDQIPIGQEAASVQLLGGGRVLKVLTATDKSEVVMRTVPEGVSDKHELIDWVLNTSVGLTRADIKYAAFKNDSKRVYFESEAAAAIARQYCTAHVDDGTRHVSKALGTTVEVPLAPGAAFSAPGYQVIKAYPLTRAKASASPGTYPSSPAAVTDNTHQVVFASPAEAERYIQSHPSAALVCSVVVEYANLLSVPSKLDYLRTRYPQGVQMREESLGVKNTARGPDNHRSRVVFDGPPTLCTKAAHDLMKMCAPHVYNVFGQMARWLMGELLDPATGLMDGWCAREGMAYIHKTGKTNNGGKKENVVFYGEHTSFGMIIGEIREYYQRQFLPRYKTIGVSHDAGLLFGDHKSAQARWLADKKKGSLGGIGDIFFTHMTGIIQMHVYSVDKCKRLAGKARQGADGVANLAQRVAGMSGGGGEGSITEAMLHTKMDQVYQEVSAYLGSLGALGSQRKCIYCKKNADRTFHLCGHHYCEGCLAARCNRATAGEPIKCGCCDELVYVKNIISALAGEDLERYCIKAAAHHLQHNRDSPVCLCVNGCTGLLAKGKGYQYCSACAQYVCPSCGVSDTSHQGLSCTQYQAQVVEASEFDLDNLFDQGRKFVNDQWGISGMSAYPLISVVKNPGLERGCPSMQRYCNAIKASGKRWHDIDTLFAWHGTSERALPSVCHQGFDPSYRSGQVYGTGEYFGQTAGISLSYSNGGHGDQMILAQIHRTERMSCSPGVYCYVVNNPLDFNSAYNLPLLVMTFKNPKCTRPFTKEPQWILTDPVPLPLPLKRKRAAPRASPAKPVPASRPVPRASPVASPSAAIPRASRTVARHSPVPVASPSVARPVPRPTSNIQTTSPAKTPFSYHSALFPRPVPSSASPVPAQPAAAVRPSSNKPAVRAPASLRPVVAHPKPQPQPQAKAKARMSPPMSPPSSRSAPSAPKAKSTVMSPEQLEQVLRSASCTAQAFQWEFQTNDRDKEGKSVYQRYSDHDSHFLEAAYRAWRKGTGPAAVTLDCVANGTVLNDTQQNYKVFFSEKRIYQQNTSAGTLQNKRNVQRVTVKTDVPAKRVWQYCTTDKSRVVPNPEYRTFESVHQAPIDRAFMLHRAGTGPSSITTTFAPFPEEYCLDFVAMTQLNVKSRTRRAIRYVDATAPHLLALGVSKADARRLLTFDKYVPEIEASLYRLVCEYVGSARASSLSVTDLNPRVSLSANRELVLVQLQGVSKDVSSNILVAVREWVQTRFGVATLSCQTFGPSPANTRLMGLAHRQPEKKGEGVARGKARTQAEALGELVHSLIWEGGFSVYGGWVKEWVVRGVACPRVCCLVPAAETNTAMTHIRNLMVAYALQGEKVTLKNSVNVTLKSQSKGWSMEVVLVASTQAPTDPRDRHLVIDARGRLGVLVPSSEPLADTLKRIRAQK
ncbi:hypothetical protein KIPB_006835, partial [Kipferlia bialata]